MPHTCHALGCAVPVKPRLLMCAVHWRLVPDVAKDEVYATYEPGQERTKRTTQAYGQAAAVAVILVAKQEGKCIPPILERMAAATEDA